MRCTWRDGTAAARWEMWDGKVVVLCQSCLDASFDTADEDEMLEPIAWSWLPGVGMAA